jgi:hypothetical protein
MKFNVYRETKSRKRADFMGHVEPTKVKSVEADTAYDAAVKFANGMTQGWRDRIIEVGYRGRDAHLWVRRFTPSGRYKGETHFLIWPAPK